MPGQRILDPQKLWELLKDDPTTSAVVLAAKLTEHNSYMGTPRVVNPSAVHGAIYRNRAKWEADGLDLTPRSPGRGLSLTALLRQNTGLTIPDAFQDQKELLYLRVIGRMRANSPVMERHRRRAMAWEAKLRKNRMVVDLDPTGRPFVRFAAPEECRENGELIDIVAGPKRW